MNKELLTELKEKFDSLKKETGFKSSFKELNDIFFIEDFILQEKYVSKDFARQLCSRIVNVYNSWVSYFHGLIMPNPANMINIMENKCLNEEERKKISKLIRGVIGLISTNNLNFLTKNKTAQAKFIDDSVKFWKNYFKAEAIKIIEKINKEWKKSS